LTAVIAALSAETHDDEDVGTARAASAGGTDHGLLSGNPCIRRQIIERLASKVGRWQARREAWSRLAESALVENG
jgi:hypothetical protein